MRKVIIKNIMVEETKNKLKELNSLGLFDDRPKPYFEYDINCGWCDEWADDVVKELERVGIKAYTIGNDNFKKYEYLPNHVFVVIGKKYYDCECLEGVTKVLDLPIYSRNLKMEREDVRKLY